MKTINKIIDALKWDIPTDSLSEILIYRSFIDEKKQANSYYKRYCIRTINKYYDDIDKR